MGNRQPHTQLFPSRDGWPSLASACSVQSQHVYHWDPAVGEGVIHPWLASGHRGPSGRCLQRITRVRGSTVSGSTAIHCPSCQLPSSSSSTISTPGTSSSVRSVASRARSRVVNRMTAPAAATAPVAASRAPRERPLSSRHPTRFLHQVMDDGPAPVRVAHGPHPGAACLVVVNGTAASYYRCNTGNGDTRVVPRPHAPPVRSTLMLGGEATACSQTLKSSPPRCNDYKPPIRSDPILRHGTNEYGKCIVSDRTLRDGLPPLTTTR